MGPPAGAQTAPGPPTADSQSIVAVIPPCGAPGNSPLPSGPAEINVNLVPAGGPVVVIASGFTPGAVVVLKAQASSTPAPDELVPLGEAVAGPEGTVVATVAPPAGIAPEAFRILVYGASGAGCLVLRTPPGTTSVLGETFVRGFTLAKTTLAPGESTGAGGQGCAPSAAVVFTLDSGKGAIGTTADGQGNFRGSITIPKGTTFGPHTVSAACGSLVQTDPITVVPPQSSSLPFTGFNLVHLWWVALAFVAVGALLEHRARRRSDVLA
jgi:hypothetical protein